MVIDPAFDNVFAEAKGRILVATFASLISRIQQVADAAARHGRKMALVGPSMIENVKMARKLGYLNMADELLIPIDQALNMQGHKVVIMCTGSQGEPSSIVGRLSTEPTANSILSPGYDRAFIAPHSRQRRGDQQDHQPLMRRGATVIYEASRRCMFPDTPARRS